MTLENRNNTLQENKNNTVHQEQPQQNTQDFLKYHNEKNNIRTQENIEETRDSFWDKIKNILAGVVIGTASLLDSHAYAAETRSIGVGQNGDALYLNSGIGNFHLQGQSNFDDTIGFAGTYEGGGDNNKFVLGTGYSQKDKVGAQRGVGIGFTHNIENHSYIDAMFSAKEFSSELENYAKSKEYKALLGAGINIFENLSIHGRCGISHIKADGYNVENNMVCIGGVNYLLPNNTYISGTYEYNAGGNSRMSVGLIILFGGADKKPNIASINMRQNMMNEHSFFSNNMVKTKKETITTPETPILYPLSDVTIHDSAGAADTRIHTLLGENLENATCTITNDPTGGSIRVQKGLSGLTMDQNTTNNVTNDPKAWYALRRDDQGDTEYFENIKIKCGSSEQAFNLTVRGI